MPNVICPNCRSVVPAGPTCIQCNAHLGFQASIVEEETAILPQASLETMEATSIDVSSDLDPRLQKLVANAKQGVRKLSTSSTGTDEVAVIAKVTDIAAWEALSEVRVGAEIGKVEDGDTTLVTGRIPVGRIEFVRQQPFVKSLKAAQKLRAALHKTIEEIGSRTDLLPKSHLADGGSKATVGIVDFGCDFAHQNFLNSDGTSRILAIWDQTGPSSSTSPFGFGKLFTKADINAALKQQDPYAALGYAPPPDSIFERGTHGTHVMDIAAGNGRGSGVPGVAPNADLVFVEVSSSDIPFSGPQAVGKSFGDSVQLLEALKFIFNFAGNRPCVINVSLGTNGGPHDGSTLVEMGIDSLLTQASNRAVCIAASNSFSDSIHASGKVPAGGFFDLIWEVPSQDSTSNELELWYSGDDRFDMEIIAPNGDSLLRVGAGENSQALRDGNRIVLLAANRLSDPNNGDNMIGIFLERGLPLGRWTVRLHGISVTDGTFHAWIERDDIGQSSFAPPNDNSHTIGSISSGQQTIVVGSYDAHKRSLPLSFFSSAGPTRDGRQKPEVSAPGHDVLAAHSRTKNRVIGKSGTSMASPAVTGTIALALSEANARGLPLSSQDIRNIVIQAARRNPPAGSAWDGQFGHGRISASAVVSAVIALAPKPPVAAARAGRRSATKKKESLSSKKRGGSAKRVAASKKAGAKKLKISGKAKPARSAKSSKKR
jgi:subtilisin family serine protease